MHKSKEYNLRGLGLCKHLLDYHHSGDTRRHRPSVVPAPLPAPSRHPLPCSPACPSAAATSVHYCLLSANCSRPFVAGYTLPTVRLPPPSFKNYPSLKPSFVWLVAFLCSIMEILAQNLRHRQKETTVRWASWYPSPSLSYFHVFCQSGSVLPPPAGTAVHTQLH